MAWLSQFKLGRPGYEVLFDGNPMSMTIKDTSISVRVRNLAGDLNKSVIKTYVPTVTIHTDYMTVTQRNLLSALAGTQDTFLSFQTRDDWKMTAEMNVPITTGTVAIQNSSISKLDTLLTSLSFSGVITITGVFTTPNGSGTNYYSGGYYTSATRIITLGTALSNLNPVFCSYTYKGWLVDLQEFPYTSQAGWLDRMTADFTLEGV